METSDTTTDILERHAHAIIQSLSEGESAALAMINGGTPNLEALDRWAEMMDVLRVEVARGRLSLGPIRPTEEDVRAVRHLAGLVRDGGPREAVIQAAWRVYRITADPGAVQALHDLLPWLAGEEILYYPWDTALPDEVHAVLDLAAAFCERGGNVRGFVPAAEDLSRIRRLRELVTAKGIEEVAERQRVAKDLLARLPPRWVDPRDAEGTGT